MSKKMAKLQKGENLKTLEESEAAALSGEEIVAQALWSGTWTQSELYSY